MDTLYCFKLNMVTGEITRTEINSYHTNMDRYNQKYVYGFKMNFGTKYDYHYRIKEDKLDHFSHDKIFSFDPDIKKAKNIMYVSLKEKQKKAYITEKKLATLTHAILVRNKE